MDKIVFIENVWANKIIPAILIDSECVFPGLSDVWIPADAYKNSSYSTRSTTEIKDFTGTDEVKQDVLTQWQAEKTKIYNTYNKK